MKPALPMHRIRPAVAADAAAVARVLCASRAAFLPYAPMAHGPDEVRRWIAEVLVPGGGVHVALRGPEVVAMLAVSQGPALRWIDQLYVDPGHTRRGIGGALLQLAHDLLAPPVRLYTFQANAGARRFYERHGYRAIAFSDGADNEERCPDVLYEWSGGSVAAPPNAQTLQDPPP